MADPDNRQTMVAAAACIFDPVLPAHSGDHLDWGHLYGSSPSLALVTAAQHYNGLVVVITRDVHDALQMEEELRFYSGEGAACEVSCFPDWETLPYDIFSPHHDIISQRLGTLYHLPGRCRGILLIAVNTLMQRLVPRLFLEQSSLMLEIGDTFDLLAARARLEAAGYQCVSQVMEHGEFAVRGNLIDLFPMGSRMPFRIDLFDDEIESIRTFDVESQCSVNKLDRIQLLPARELPTDEAAITRFRKAFRRTFEGDPNNSIIYREVSKGRMPAGIEYYLPLFFEQTQTLFDYLPDDALIIYQADVPSAARRFFDETVERFEQGRCDPERPLLPPGQLFLDGQTLDDRLGRYRNIAWQRFELASRPGHVNYATQAPPHLNMTTAAQEPFAGLHAFIDKFRGRILFAVETPGRREILMELLRPSAIHPQSCNSWTEFLHGELRLGICLGSFDDGLVLSDTQIAVITESQLFGEHVVQRRRRKTKSINADAVIKNLTELEIGAPVVHEEHGVGRYHGLQTLTVGGVATEFLTLTYAEGDKLYVPVASLHLISRYSGAAPDQAPLHKLGSGQWQRARQRAAKRVRDAAAELLDIYARRAARIGHVFPRTDDQYAAFVAAFPFEETPDQQAAIDAVLDDMTSAKTMDRLICGDVGFGKTEVAMRAAFHATYAGHQVAVLVPTTLLAQQHYQNFRDRFAGLPVNIEMLSRFRDKKAQQTIINGIASSTIDIIIGTHKLLQQGIRFKRLGLAIIDEEHRFGVRQKERFKSLRSEVDVLTLTATPIPRTLNMALASLRDLSIIASPPAHRLAIKTFVREWNDMLIHEAITREVRRGGQVYFLHNKVEDIERIAARLRGLVPNASIRTAHGQMRERRLEQVMLDFYHQRFNVLVCTTIIETGIDIPTANTILINRADRFGLAQLYQLRGRVGRSHHRAYAYLIVPPRQAMTADAVKRLEAIESLEELGAGFTLATHDLEIRGAGELLGEEQSGQIQEIGFTLYTQMLERAVRTLREGGDFDPTRPLELFTEVDLRIPALIPEDYIPDVHTRLVMYKRIASAADNSALRDLQVEMIDRFGLLPDATRNLFRTTQLKLAAQSLGIRRVEANAGGGRFLFSAEPNVAPERLIDLIRKAPQIYRFEGPQKLRFKQAIPDAADRLQITREIFVQLGCEANMLD